MWVFILDEAVISNFVVKSYPSEDDIIETLFIQTTVTGQITIIGVKPHNMDPSSFNAAFSNLLTALALERRPLLSLTRF